MVRGADVDGVDALFEAGEAELALGMLLDLAGVSWQALVKLEPIAEPATPAAATPTTASTPVAAAAATARPRHAESPALPAPSVNTGAQRRCGYYG